MWIVPEMGTDKFYFYFLVSEVCRVQIRLKANYMIIFMGLEESLILRECDKLQSSEYKAHS